MAMVSPAESRVVAKSAVYSVKAPKKADGSFGWPEDWKLMSFVTLTFGHICEGIKAKIAAGVITTEQGDTEGMHLLAVEIAEMFGLEYRVYPRKTVARESLLSVLEGGPGSGHFDHAGIPGHQGGSAKGTGQKRLPMMPPKTKVLPPPKTGAWLLEVHRGGWDDFDYGTFDYWENEQAKEIAREMLESTELGSGRYKKSHTLTWLRDEDGDVRAVALVAKGAQFHTLQYLASDVKGGGTRLMALVCDAAARAGAGIGGNALESAVDFYRKIGMQEKALFVSFTAEEAKGFANRVLRGKK
jgi:hypothetical protein